MFEWLNEGCFKEPLSTRKQPAGVSFEYALRISIPVNLLPFSLSLLLFLSPLLESVFIIWFLGGNVSSVHNYFSPSSEAAHCWFPHRIEREPSPALLLSFSLFPLLPTSSLSVFVSLLLPLFFFFTSRSFSTSLCVSLPLSRSFSLTPSLLASPSLHLSLYSPSLQLKANYFSCIHCAICTDNYFHIQSCSFTGKLNSYWTW